MLTDDLAAPARCVRARARTPKLRHLTPPVVASALARLAQASVAAAAIAIAGKFSGPLVVTLALVGGITSFDLARRGGIERSAVAVRVRDPFGNVMRLASVAILCAAAWDNRSQTGWPVLGALDAVGLAAIAGGVDLRRRAARALGRHFTVTLSLLEHHQLVVTGPYRWLRHPNYTGLALVALGTAMMARSTAAAWVAAAIWLPAMLLRVRDEERTLRRALASAYTDYSRHTSRFVPGIY